MQLAAGSVVMVPPIKQLLWFILYGDDVTDLQTRISYTISYILHSRKYSNISKC